MDRMKLQLQNLRVYFEEWIIYTSWEKSIFHSRATSRILYSLFISKITTCILPKKNMKSSFQAIETNHISFQVSQKPNEQVTAAIYRQVFSRLMVVCHIYSIQLYALVCISKANRGQQHPFLGRIIRPHTNYGQYISLADFPHGI